MLIPLISGALRVSDTARVGVRNNLIDGHTQLDLDDSLRAELTLTGPALQVELSYAPRFTLVDSLAVKPTPALLHSGELRIQYRHPRSVFSLWQTGAIGQQSYTDVIASRAVEAAAGSPPSTTSTTVATAPRFDLVPRATALWIAAERTQGKFWHLWSRRWSSELQASFGTSGGFGTSEQRLLPRQNVADVGLNVSYELTTRDRLTLLGNGSYIWTSEDYKYWLAGVSAQWYTQLGRHTSTTLLAGIVHQRGVRPDDTKMGGFAPVAAASVNSGVALGHLTRAELFARADYGPALNLLLGRLQTRVSATLGVSLARDRLNAAVGVIGSQTLPSDDPSATRSIGLDSQLAYRLSDAFDGVLGAQVGKQTVPQATAVSSLLWVCYAGLTVHNSPWRF